MTWLPSPHHSPLTPGGNPGPRQWCFCLSSAAVGDIEQGDIWHGPPHGHTAAHGAGVCVRVCMSMCEETGDATSLRPHRFGCLAVGRAEAPQLPAGAKTASRATGGRPHTLWAPWCCATEAAGVLGCVMGGGQGQPSGRADAGPQLLADMGRKRMAFWPGPVRGPSLYWPVRLSATYQPEYLRER